jgi:hypothetical protein
MAVVTLLFHWLRASELGRCHNEPVATEDILAGVRRIEERWQEERERWMQRDVTVREFMDALTDRHVRVTQAMIGAIGDLQAEIADQRAEIADQRQQIQANTQALLRLLDERFGPEPPQG